MELLILTSRHTIKVEYEELEQLILVHLDLDTMHLFLSMNMLNRDIEYVE